MWKIVFWFSVFFVGYAFVGYPLILKLISLFRNRAVKKSVMTPRVSFIITAYNEEKRIREKIENSLKQDYPKDKLEIIVASDCSTDATEEIVGSYQTLGIRLVRATERKGKENAQKHAVDASSGEILIFSDVATILEPDGISRIVANFNDPSVGCVSSVDRFVESDGSISGEGAYVRFEMFLRGLETKVNTVVGLSGSFFAARREVCRNWATDLQSDFNTLLNSVRLGLRGISDPESVGFYKNIADERKEYDRKVRTVIRGISVFMKSLPLLNPFRYRLFAWQLFSHKLCRWLVPFALIAAFASNLLLSSKSVLYLSLFVLQVFFYGSALLGMGGIIKNSLLKIPSFFLLVNLSILNAWYRYIRGDRMVKWTPSER
jgi:cellulose synthase/poly-beta-1,6-N-acetylglucosamine synthase-like glycosyltransferase